MAVRAGISDRPGTLGRVKGSDRVVQFLRQGRGGVFVGDDLNVGACATNFGVFNCIVDALPAMFFFASNKLRQANA